MQHRCFLQEYACLRLQWFTSVIILLLLMWLVFYSALLICNAYVKKKNLLHKSLYFSFDAGESELANKHLKIRNMPLRQKQYELTVKRKDDNWYG